MITIDYNIINFSLFVLFMSIKTRLLKNNVVADFKIAIKILPEPHNILSEYRLLPHPNNKGVYTNRENLVFLG